VQSYPLTASATPISAEATDGRYTFHPLGIDMPLFNRPQTQTELSQVAEEVNLPVPIGRRAFDADLKAYRATPKERQPANSHYYGPQRSLNIMKDGTAVPPIEVMSADLQGWARPPQGLVAVDVHLGRVAFAPGNEPKTSLSVSYNYGFSADIGGGPYDRRPTLVGAGPVTRQDFVSSTQELTEALSNWPQNANTRVIQIADSGVYELSEITLPPQASLVIQAADGARPVIRSGGTLTVRGQDTHAASALNAALTLNGLLLDGRIHIQGNLQFGLKHSTVLGGIRGGGDAPDLQVTITHSIVGPLHLTAEISGLIAQDSIVDAAPGYAIAAGDSGELAGPPATLARTTIFGQVRVKELTLASEVIFTAAVVAERQQTGAVRFSVVPDGSRTPQRYRCQPDLALVGVRDTDEQVRVQRRLMPSFTSKRCGDPGYAQLSPSCAPEIRSGAEDGSEMGVFQHLHQPQREANLRSSLDEYLPSGLEAGIFYVS